MKSKQVVTILTVIVVLFSYAFILSTDDVDADNLPIEAYNYNTDYESVKGTSCNTDTQVTLPSVSEVRVANSDEITITKWQRGDTGNHVGQFKHVVTEIKGIDPASVRIGTEAQGYQDVVSYAVIDGVYWVGTVWDGLHILSDGGKIVIDREAMASPNSEHHWETRGGFTIEGNETSRIISNNESIHIDTYHIVKDNTTFNPASAFTDISYTIRSVNLNFGLWVNDFSLNNVSKDTGNIESLSLIIDDVTILTANGGITFYSQSGQGTRLETKLQINDSSISVSDNVATYACYTDEIDIQNTSYVDCAKGIVATHKSDEPMNVVLKDVSFQDCGYGVSGQESSSAPIVIASRGSGDTVATIEDCPITYVSKTSQNGDILLGSKNNDESKSVDLTLITGSDACDVRIWKGEAQETQIIEPETKNEITGTGVGETIVIDQTTLEPDIPVVDEDDSYTQWYQQQLLAQQQAQQQADEQKKVTYVAIAAGAVAALMALMIVAIHSGKL